MIDKSPFRTSRPILPEETGDGRPAAWSGLTARSSVPGDPADGIAEDELRRVRSREAHLATEELIRTLGVCAFVLSAVFARLPLRSLLIDQSGGASRPAPGNGLLLMGCSIALLAGAGLLQCRWWGRPPAVVLCLWGLLLFPVGTFIAATSLVILFSPGGRTVLTSDYARVRAATPAIRCSVIRVAGLSLMVLTLATVQWFLPFSFRMLPTVFE